MRRPSAKAAAAGDTPKEICRKKKEKMWSASSEILYKNQNIILRRIVEGLNVGRERRERRAEEERTRSASESSSWPMRLLFFLQRATLPSIKSKKRPKGMKARAAQRLPSAEGGPRQYRMDEKMDMMPQNPNDGKSHTISAYAGPSSQGVGRGGGMEGHPTNR